MRAFALLAWSALRRHNAARKHVFDTRRKLRLDMERGVVELVIVDGADVVLATSNAVHPFFAFALEGGKVLALLGQWLWEARIYGAQSSGVIETEQQGNGLPAPWSFPATAFTVHRLPRSGDVLRIEVRGEYLAPVAGDAIVPMPGTEDSYVADRWW